MITIGMNYKVLAGKETVFENAFAGVLVAMRENGEHVKSELYRQIAGENDYLILSEWKTKEGFRSFVSSERFAQVTAWGRDQILAGRPSHRVLGE